jgi:hypothetical protein
MTPLFIRNMDKRPCQIPKRRFSLELTAIYQWFRVDIKLGKW